MHYDNYFLSQFGTVITMDRSSIHPHLIYTQPGLSWHVEAWFKDSTKILRYNDLKNWNPKKTKLCSVISSNKTLSPQHTKRLEFFNKMKERFLKEIDFYGREINIMEDKYYAFTDYRYHSVLENCDFDNYWTEKITDPFLALTYPIYYRCKNLKKYFDGRSFTHIDIDKLEESFKIISTVLSLIRIQRIFNI